MRRIYSILIVLAIIAHGVFKIHILKFYTDFLLGISWLDSDSIIAMFNQISTRGDFIDYYLGWLIYFPTYGSLHFLLVFILFSNDHRTRNIILVSLSSAIALCLLFVFIGQVSNIAILNKIGYDTLKKLIAIVE